MRGLRGDQQLHYAIPEQLMMKLPSPSVQAIFKHGAINDAEQRGGEHWKSAQDQITNVPRRALLDAIISSPTVRDVVVRISAARDFLSQQEQEDHYLQMQAPHAAQDPRMILEKQKAAIEKQLETTLKKGFEGEEQKIQEQIQRGWSNVMSILFPEGKSSKLPSRVEAELEELGSSIQIKATQKQELELEEEQVARSINKTRELVSLSFKVKDCSPDQYKACPIEHEGDYMNWRWRSLFKWENCLQLTERFTKRFTTPEPDSPLVPMTHLRVVYESGTPQLIALHAYEIDYLMTFETDTSTSPIHLIDLSGSSRVKIGPVPELSGPQRIQFEDQLQQAQLMQGELLALMKKEKPSPWLQQLGKEKPAELLAFLQEWVRPQFPIATEVLQAFMKWVR